MNFFNQIPFFAISKMAKNSKKNIVIDSLKEQKFIKTKEKGTAKR